MPSLQDRVAIVTGAGRGMGRAHALRMAREGAELVLVDVEPHAVPSIEYRLAGDDELQTTAAMVREWGSKALTVVADVRSQADLDAVARATMESFGRIDILVSNAGLLSVAPIWQITDRQWQDVIDVNLTGMWHAIKSVAPQMMEQRRGSIVLISSTNGIEPGKQFAHYTAAKHGVLGLMKAAALELAPFDIRCNAVCPGATDTAQNSWQGAMDMMAGHPGATADERLRQGERYGPLASAGWIPPESIADAVAWLASDEARYITGSAIAVDAGHLLIPGYVPDHHQAPADGI